MDIDIFTNFQLAEGIDVFQNVYHRMIPKRLRMQKWGFGGGFSFGGPKSVQVLGIEC